MVTVLLALDEDGVRPVSLLSSKSRWMTDMIT